MEILEEIPDDRGQHRMKCGSPRVPVRRISGCMRAGLSHLVAALAAVMMIAGSSQAQPADQELYLVYDEQHIPDADRAQFVRLVADCIEWRTVPAPRSPLARWLIEFLVKKYYAFYTGGYRETTNTLIDLITAANPMGRIVDKIQVPQVPMSGNAQFGFGATLRVFNPTRQAYEVTRDLSRIVAPQTTNGGPVVDNDPRRGTNLTAVRFPVSALLDRIRRDPRTRALLQRSVLPSAPTGLATVVFHAERPNDCNSPIDWLPASPYLKLWDKQRPQMSNGTLQRVLQRAEKSPLSLIDWGFSPAWGHGSKVRSAARYVLTTLGVPDLARPPFLTVFELNPLENKQGISDLIDRYYKARVKAGSFDPDVLSVLLNKTKQWIKSPPATDSTHPEQFVVPEFLLQALFWQYFDRTESWVNMSFSIHSTSLDVLSATLLIGSASQGFFSAGNDLIELDSNSVPQFGAALYRNMVNTTYGTDVGSVFGTFSSPQAPVTLVAPGCGIAFETLTASDYGSSFASPYVAAAAWLWHLLDEGTATGRNVRADLILASRPAPAMIRAIESGGVFDPALLLTRLGPHFIDGSGAVVAVNRLDLRLTFKDTSQQSIVVAPGSSMRPTRTLIITDCPSGPCVWYRALTLLPNPSYELRKGAPLSDISGTIQTESGSTLQLTGVAHFRSMVSQLWF